MSSSGANGLSGLPDTLSMFRQAMEIWDHPRGDSCSRSTGMLRIGSSPDRHDRWGGRGGFRPRARPPPLRGTPGSRRMWAGWGRFAGEPGEPGLVLDLESRVRISSVSPRAEVLPGPAGDHHAPGTRILPVDVGIRAGLPESSSSPPRPRRRPRTGPTQCATPNRDPHCPHHPHTRNLPHPTLPTRPTP